MHVHVALDFPYNTVEMAVIKFDSLNINATIIKRYIRSLLAAAVIY